MSEHEPAAHEQAGWTRPLGATGLTVTALTIGGSPLGSVPLAYGTSVSSAQGIDVARAVMESPIRVLDTANGYSEGESERRIGRAIALIGGLPADFLVITKVDASGRDYSGDRVRQSVRESKERLGLDHLPLVHLHDPEFFGYDEVTASGGAIDTLLELKAEGEIGHVGLAGGDSRVMRDYLDLGVFEVLLVHNRWTLVDRSAGDLIDRAVEMGVGVVNAAIYGGGILAEPKAKTLYGYRPASKTTLTAVEEMVRLCERWETSLSTAALQFSLADPRFASTIVGTSSRHRLADLLAASAQRLPYGFWAELETLVPDPRSWLDAEGGRGRA